MLIEAVERRFGAVEAIPVGHQLEFLSDNGGAYIAADTRAMARALGLTPINTPVCSPQTWHVPARRCPSMITAVCADIDLVDHTDWPQFVADYRIGVEPDQGPVEPEAF